MELQALLRSMGSQGKSSARAEQGPRLIQLPHFQFKEIMKRRKRQDRLGPGTYNIKDFLQEMHPTSIRGICDTRDERFRDAHGDCFPGPGTYGNPYILLDERDKRSASTRGMMESRTAKCAPTEAAGSGLGPGTYSLRSSIGQTVSGGRLKPTGGGCQALEKQKKGSEAVAVPVKNFLDELMSNENKKKGCFSTLPRDPGCPTERIFWFTLSQCPRKNVMGPGSYNLKPIGKSACNSQTPSWSTAKRFDRNFYRLFTGNENPVGAGRYNISKHEKYPQKTRYQSLYQCDAQRYLSNLKRDAYLLKRLKPVAKINWWDLISAPRCPDTSEEITFPKARWCWKAQVSE
ncbi:LOW QUALITY PROTEIN: lymphocyte expansion molecule [Pezoporus wallicus]|uniref:LOW QUALITY PROTEIN: lymphocyte expansion molecule n=1 Tax=Pezoporus wallicus TaxID=35540 RepID=UPI00254D8BC8|nr:LOW QUALITY PROTEIN: lymphocyte expansion molecule [Pezoporus wallicus]